MNKRSLMRLPGLCCLILLAGLGTGSAAGSKVFILSGTNAMLQDVTDQVDVFYTAMRLNRVLNQWNVNAAVSNRSSGTLPGPFVLLVDGYSGTTGPVQPDGMDSEIPTNAWYHISSLIAGGGLASGNTSALRTLALGMGIGTPRMSARVYAGGSSGLVGALARSRSLNAIGQPLAGVTVAETGPVGTASKATDAVLGIVTLGQGAGDHVWKFSAPGALPTWRRAVLTSNDLTVVPNPRLASRGTNTVDFTPLGGGVLTNGAGSLEITFPPGAFSQATTGVLTPLTGQTLPAFLPQGWSPLQAFSLELTSEPAFAGSVQMQPWGEVSSTEGAAWVHWNPTSLKWEVQALVPGKTSNPLSAPLLVSGSYALVVADAGLLAPAAAQPGQELPPSLVAVPGFGSLRAAGKVVPQTSPASRTAELVTAQAQVVITNAAGSGLPSGLVLRCEVTERYSMSDGSIRFSPQYENFIVAYQRPGDVFASTLQAMFPMRPLLLLGADELNQATIQVDLFPPTAFSGGLLSSDAGGQATSASLQVIAGAGDVAGQQLAQVRELVLTNFTGFASTGLTLVKAFDLDVAGVVSGRNLRLQVSGLSTNCFFVLAQVISQDGLYGLQPVERLSSDAKGVLTSLEPATGVRLPGLVGAGQYLLVGVGARQGLVTGVARNSTAQAVAGLPVWIKGQPWVTLSEAGGVFRLLALPGSATLAVWDASSGNLGQTDFTVADPQTVTSASLGASNAGPRVELVTPTNGAVSVARVSSVVIQFSKPVNPATLAGGGIQLLAANGQPVAAALTLNLRSTVATLLPTAQLTGSTVHTLLLSTNITDAAGMRLEGPNAVTFTTESDALVRDPSAQLISFEPVGGISVVAGTPGLAEPDAPVVIVNETSGRSATVVSSPDGSFTNNIQAEVDDLISVVLVNKNGTRNSVSLSRQLYRDGSISLFGGGGVLEAPTPNGPMQVIVEPGSIATKAKFKLEFVPTNSLPENVRNTPVEGGLSYGGISVQIEGDAPSREMRLAFPVPRDQLGLPVELDPTNATFGLMIPRVFTDEGGQKQVAYEIIDRMLYEDGKLVTHSAPFLGMIAPLLFQIQVIMPCLIAMGDSMMISGHVYASPPDASGNPIERDDPTSSSRIYLPGATVIAAPALGFQTRAGQLKPGTVYAMARDSSARFTIMAPLSATLGGEILTARHPRFPDQLAHKSVPALGGTTRVLLNNWLEIDLPFLTPANLRGPDTNPPVLSMGHSPSVAPVGTNNPVTLRVVAGDDRSLPTISVVVNSVTSTNPALVPASIVLTLVTNESAGAQATRSIYLVGSPLVGLAKLKVTARDASGNVTDEFYPIDFGATVPVVVNPIPAPNGNDRTPLAVVNTDPPGGSGGLGPGVPIHIRFNKPVDRSCLLDPNAILVSPAGPELSSRLSQDQLELTATLSGLQPGMGYTINLSTSIKDLVGNHLDGDPKYPGDQAYLLYLSSPPATDISLPGVAMGQGAAMLGIYAYVLEAGVKEPGVKVFDLSDSAKPAQVGYYALGMGAPRDLVLIPQYSFRRKPTSPAEVKDLLAVVGGTIGQPGGQYVRILDISSPTNIQLVAATVLTYLPDAAVVKTCWSAPILGYLTVANVSTVSLLNLQMLIIAANLSPKEWDTMPAAGVAGLDKDQDGNFTGPDDVLPLPPRVGQDVPGKLDELTLYSSRQMITDFALQDAGSFVGVTLERGDLLGTNGLPTGLKASSAYHSLMVEGALLDRGPATFDFTNAAAKRVFLLRASPFMVGGNLDLKDLALVTLRMNEGQESGRTNRLAVLDVSNPMDPHSLGEIYIPPVYGNSIFSLQRRDDGLLLLATSQVQLLLDPARLLDPTPSDPLALHPAIVGVIPGGGMGMRSYGSISAGLSVVSASGKNVVVQSAPTLQVVRFPKLPPFQPATNSLGGRGWVEQLLTNMYAADSVRLARNQAVSASGPSSLSPPASGAHYYILVRAPGSAGRDISLTLESLNAAGYPLAGRGPLFPQVRAVNPITAQKLDPGALTNTPSLQDFTAYRISDDPTDAAYNLYLSRPFALIYEEIAAADVKKLQRDFDREVLWSGAYVRVAIDPEMISNPVLKKFAASIHPVRKTLVPGPMALAKALPADYLMGPNPLPIQGGVATPASLGSLGAHNGDTMVTEMDLVLPGRRLPIEFRRSSSAQGLFEGPFGRGWDFNYNQRTIELKEEVFGKGSVIPVVDRGATNTSELAYPGDLLFFNGSCRTMVFHYAGTNPPPEVASDPLVKSLGWLDTAERFYLPPNGIFQPMFKQKDGRYCRLTPEGEQYWYDSAGRLQAIYDRFPENSVECSYNERGELVKILDELKRPLLIGYYRLSGDPFLDPGNDETTAELLVAGKVARLRDFTDRDILFEYTSDGILARKKGPEVTVSAAGGFTGRQIITYVQTGFSDLGKSSGSVRGKSTATGAGVPLIVASDVGLSGRDVAGKVLTAGKEVSLSLSHKNEAQALATSRGASTVVGQDKSKTDYKFDNFGRPTQVTLSGKNAASEETKFEYNEHGMTTNILYPEGNSEQYTFDVNNPVLRCRGNILQITKIPGPRGGTNLVATSTYDPNYNEATSKTDYNGITSFITLTGDKRGVDHVTLTGETETYGRNEFGQLEYLRSADGIERAFTYYPDTGLLKGRSVGGYTHTYYYENTAGRLGHPSRIQDPRGILTYLEYDERNQIVRERREGIQTETAFDERGFPVRIAQTVDNGLNKVVDLMYDQFGFVTNKVEHDLEVGGVLTNLVSTFEPDDASRVRRAVFPGGEIHETEYDHAGRIISYKVGSWVEEFAYDRNGNLVTNRTGNAEQIYTYDGHDRPVRVIKPDGGVIDYVMDGNQNVVSEKVTDPKDGLLSEAHYSYDERNRCVRIDKTGDTANPMVVYDYPSSSRTVVMTDANNQQVRSEFDPAGRLSHQESATRTVDLFYDDNHNLLRKQSTENGRVFKEAWNYNSRDQATNAIDGLGHATAMALRLDGQALVVTDRDGNSTSNLLTVLGEETRVTKANGVAANLMHSPNRETSGVLDSRGKGMVHTYDDVGRLQSITRADGGTVEFRNFDTRNAPQEITYPNGTVVVAGHDSMGRLISRQVQPPGGASRDETYSYDTLGRIRKVTDPSGSVEYQYAMPGYAKRITTEQQGRTYNLSQEIDVGGFRTAATMQSGLRVVTGRDSAGRLTTILPTGEPAVVAATSYSAEDLIGSRVLGPNVIQEARMYDALRRPMAITYQRIADGRSVVDLRYAFSAGGAVLASQRLHQGGRSDFYSYDGGYRLLRTDLGTRVRLTSEAPRAILGFAVPPEVSGFWSPGKYARTFAYRDTDVLSGASLLNPDALPVMPFAASYDPPDELLHVPAIDGFTRHRDQAGNVTSAQLWVRQPGQIAPQAVEATLKYDGMGQLLRVERADGVVVENEYGPHGLRIRRHITGDTSLCEPSDLAFLYEGANLVEIRDLNQSATLVARFFYGEQGDELLAGEMVDPGTSATKRYYYLSDLSRSVVAVTDASGEPVERVSYDPWGEPVLQAADPEPPRIAKVRRDGGSLLVQFSEPVLPMLIGSGGGSNLVETALSTDSLFEWQANGISAGGTVSYEESLVPFGTTFRFTPSAIMAGSWELHLLPGVVSDEWNNSNLDASVTLNLNQPGDLLYADPLAQTAPREIPRSQVSCPFLFQGQFFDYETGLIYCRARFYDPVSGLFLQPDPSGSRDSVNHYAGFANNPINFRDPTGCAVWDPDAWGRYLEEIGSQASYKKDGVQAVFGSALEVVGAVLRLGTGAAEGWEKLENARPGAAGRLDLINGAELIAKDVVTAYGVATAGAMGAKSLSMRPSLRGMNMVKVTPGRVRAYAFSARESARDMLEQRLLGRRGAEILDRNGIVDLESQAMENTLRVAQEMGHDMELSIRSKPASLAQNVKNLQRKEWVELGMPQKPAADYKGKTGWDATMKGHRGTHVVSDLDVWAIKVNGKMANTRQYRWFARHANDEYNRLFKERYGSISQPNPPFQHYGQAQVSEGVGKNFMGHIMDNAKLESMPKGPGHCISIRVNSKGNLLAYRTPAWQIDSELIKVDNALLARRAELEALKIMPGLPSSWFDEAW